MKFWKLVSSATAFVVSTSVNAALIDHGAYITDTDTGRDWLDLTETTNLSFNNVVSELGSGGVFEGWLLANYTDIEALFDHAGGNGTYRNTTGNALLFDTLLPIWSNSTSFSEIWFHTQDFTAGASTTGGVLTSGGRSYYHEDALSTPSTEYSFIGTALYRTTTVPVPAAVWLFGSGLVGLIGIARRKKA